MLSLLGKLFTALIIACSCFITLGIAQNDAVIIGKIDSPPSRVIRFEFKRNHFSLEEGSFEAVLDTNNVFAVRVKLNEPRAVFCTYRENAVKLFVAPGDTLKMRFSNSKMLETLTFDGVSASHNEYLVKMQKKFPDWLNENSLVQARLKRKSSDYLAFVDSLFIEKRRFFDSYPTIQKANFTNDFLEFATNDINYWRAYELMLYVKTYGLNNTDPMHMIDESYFNFTLETDNVYYKALNNEYYLQYLESYLGYLSEKNGQGRKEPIAIVEERSRYIQTVKSTGSNVKIQEEPYLPKEIVSWLTPGEEAIYQNLYTGEKYRYIGDDFSFEDIFVKIKTVEGKTGWVPQSSVVMVEKTIIERIVRNRFCFQPDDLLCGFSAHLSGKVLYYMAAKDILYSLIYDKIDVVDARIKKFIEKNTDHKELNDIIKEARELTIIDRGRGINRLDIPPSCEMENYWKDRVYYAKFLKKLGKEDTNEVILEVIPPKDTPKEKNSNYPQPPVSVPTLIVNTPTSIEDKTPIVNNNIPIATNPTTTNNTVNTTDKTSVVVNNTIPPITDKTTPSTPTNTNDKTPPVISGVPTPSSNTNPSKTDVTAIQHSNNTVHNTEPEKGIPPSVTPPVSTKVPPTSDAPSVVKTQSKSTDNEQNRGTLKFRSESDDKRKIEFDTTQTILSLEKYDPTGRPLIFKGMVINENITPFEMTDVNKNPVRQQDLLGKIVVLDFWATWCGPCKPTLEYTQRLAQKYSDKDVVFIYVSIDSDEETWKVYLKEHPLRGIHGMDDNALIRINLRVQGVPNYFIIDKKGRIAYNSLIRSSYNAEEWIDMLLKSP